MSLSLPRLSGNFTICGAAACAALTLLMQHTSSCALWLEEHLFAMSFYSSAHVVPQTLLQFGDMLHLGELDRAEKCFADGVSEVLIQPLAEGSHDIFTPLARKTIDNAEVSEKDKAENIPAQEGDTSAIPAMETPSGEALTQTVALVETRAIAATSTSGITNSPLQEGSAAQFVAESLRMPFPGPCCSEKEHGWNMQRMTGSTPQNPLTMVDALEYALGSHGNRRAATPQLGRQSLKQRQPLVEEKTEVQYTPRRDFQQHQSLRMAKLVASAAAASQRPKSVPQRLAVVGGGAQVQPSPVRGDRAPQEAAPPSSPGDTPPMRYRILMLGDSLMEDLGPMMHRMMRHRKGLEFIISAKYSTGLCRPDYFNWPRHMNNVVRRYLPDLVIFFIGANDGMPIRQGNGLVPTGRETWRAAYAAKMDELVGIARSVGADIIWVELPAVGGTYNKLLHQTQVAQRTYCESNGITTLRTDPFLSGEWGRFEPYGDYHGSYTRLRTKDQTHLTRQGNLKILEHLLPVVEQRMSEFYAKHPERWLTAGEVSRIHRVPAVYTCQYTLSRSAKERNAGETTQPTANTNQQ